MASHDFSKMFAIVSRVFRKASEDDLRDLEDALSVDVAADNWNQRRSDGETKNNTTGPMESASGKGADQMVGRYSDPQPQSGISADYAERFEQMEKAIIAIVEAKLAEQTAKA